jgi:single-stranded DNA-binding protein
VSLDINLVVLRGRLAADPECRTFDSGSRLIRYLVTVRQELPRRRVDVVPVTLWDPPDELWDEPGVFEDRLWAVGSIQRRYWEGPEGRRSRIEVVAEQVQVDRPVVLAGADGEAGHGV